MGCDSSGHVIILRVDISQAFIDSYVGSCAIGTRIAWRASRERRGAAAERKRRQSGGRAWRHAAGRGQRGVEAEGVVHMRVASRWPSIQSKCPRCRSHSSFHFCTFKRSREPVFAWTRIPSLVFVPRGIYDSTLWTPTLLVHHLLSQSSRLTRQIDMRQARDYVSIKPSNICQYLKFSNTLSSLSCAVSLEL